MDARTRARTGAAEWFSRGPGCTRDVRGATGTGPYGAAQCRAVRARQESLVRPYMAGGIRTVSMMCTVALAVFTLPQPTAALPLTL